MVQGKRATDSSLESEVDLLSLKPWIVGYANGAECPLSVIQIARFREALIAQYTHVISKNDRALSKATAQTTIEHAIGLEGILRGERLAIDTLLELGKITDDGHVEFGAQITIAEQHYKRLAAQHIHAIIVRFESILARKGKGGGRPASRKTYNPTDHEIIIEAAKKMTPERGDASEWVREIRQVVKEYQEAGRLPRRGGTGKESIDIHMQRLTRASRSAKKSR